VAVREDVIEAVALMTNQSADGRVELAQRLITHGYSPLRAQLLEDFVSLALGRIWLRQLGATPPILVANYVQISCAGKKYREIPLSDVPEYTEALAAGEAALTNGAISWEQLGRCCDSPEVVCIKQTIEAGRPAGGGTMSPPILMRLPELAGFDSWYKSLPSRRRWWRFWG
jgi:hypothetical protein